MEKVLVYIYDGMADYEISLLVHFLGADCGKEIVTISDKKVVRNKAGMLFESHYRTNEVNVDDNIEGIIIPGGWRKELDYHLIRLLQELNVKNKLLAAICAAPWMLAKAGILNDVVYTTSISRWQQQDIDFYGFEDPFPRERFQDKRVVRDRNIITAKGIAFIDFAIEVCDYFRLFKDVSEKEELVNELKGR